MKIRSASAVVGFAVLLLASVPAAQAQRGGAGGRGMGGPGGGGGRGGTGGGRPVNSQTSPRVSTTVPSTPILPITNPIAPITNPVGPIVPTGVTNSATRNVPANRPIRPNSPRRDNFRENVIVVGGPYGYWPNYYGWYPQPYLEPAPVPGELPGVYRYQDPGYDPQGTYSVPPDPPDNSIQIVQPEPTFFPDQNIIITLPEPDRVVVPPPLGTSKSDALARYGEPWGSMRTASGKETMYFRGGLSLVFENGKVSEIR